MLADVMSLQMGPPHCTYIQLVFPSLRKKKRKYTTCVSRRKHQILIWQTNWVFCLWEKKKKTMNLFMFNPQTKLNRIEILSAVISSRRRNVKNDLYTLFVCTRTHERIQFKRGTLHSKKTQNDIECGPIFIITHTYDSIRSKVACNSWNLEQRWT